ncbi:uncharacterized protein KGF55_003981 [Candida pseudojiufengensis]|uniref:uncharacterized protein n=1 Tax=Candida pseudojiufengensis TaxID=497109 RepID=UPI0022241C62|nr:uncharacterized protein KGF55_003981 [Candida pseudojiufengensis]KAI5961664.1 hypothetical protein KGF55_003981 [Candida pseudojiufengensis]
MNNRFAQAVAIRLNTSDHKLNPERRRKFEEIGKTEELVESISKLNKDQIGGNYTDCYHIAANNNFNNIFCQKIVPIFKKWENNKTINLPDVDEFFIMVQNDVRFVQKKIEICKLYQNINNKL